MNKNNPELIKEAKNNPNGWVYVLDKEFEGKQEVPPEFIRELGKWTKKEKLLENLCRIRIIEEMKNKKRFTTMYNRNYGGFDYVRIHSELLTSVLKRK